MSNALIKPADRIGDLRPYAPPLRDSRIILALDNNEGAPIDASMLGVICTVSPEDISVYPDQSPLEARIARQFSIDPERVVLTCGGDDAIDRVCRALLSPGDTMLTHAPGFVMIPRWAQLAGADVRSIDWLSGPFPIGLFLESIDETTTLVSLISPCNPTGQIITTDDILAIVERARLVGAVVMLDQAYIEFADDDPADRLLDASNVVLVRTFSKAMGAAGLRVGYAIAPETIAEWLRSVAAPYPVSSISLRLAEAIMDARSSRERCIGQTRQSRQGLVSLLRRDGVTVLNSQANFVLARFRNAEETHADLLAQGISVRRFSTGGEIERYLRITVPSCSRQFQQLLDALRAIGAVQ
jgi:histidinol-phosphate aminotransferase